MSTKPARKTILLTSIGSRSAIGVVESLKPVRDKIRLIATNSLATAAGNYLADRTVLVPKTSDSDGWRTALSRLIKDERPACVLVGRDEELALLSEMAADPKFSSTTFLIPPRESVAVFNDKYETSLFARRNGLPFADTAFGETEARALKERHGLPIVAKMRTGGHASKLVFFVTSDKHFEACLADGRLVFQELLAPETFAETQANWAGHLGIPWKWAVESRDQGIDMVLDRADIVASSLSQGRAQGGMHVDVELIDHPAMRDVLKAYATAFGRSGHVGPLNLQGKLLADGRYVPYELNARFVGTTMARTCLGVNLVLAALDHFGIIESPANPVEAATAVERLSLFLAFPQSAALEMSKRGEWHRKPAR